jgi:hypothetical protein
VSSGTAGGSTTGTPGTQGSGTVTASLYSVYALASKQDPLKPSVYNSHAGMRKFFFTLGREQQNTSSSSSASSSSGSSPSSNALPKAATTTAAAATPAAQPGTVYGLQWLIVNNRDASAIIRRPQSFAKLTGIAQMEAGIIAKYTKLLSDALCNHQACNFSDANAVVQAVAKLTKDQKAELDKVVDEYSTESKKADVANALTIAVQELEQRSQFSLNFQTTQRSSGLPDDYRAELVFDRGFQGGWLLTLNGSYDYSNSAMIGADLRTERGALQISRNLINSGTYLKSPLSLNLSGKGEHQDTGWHYRAQLQLVVPVSTGITFPISFGYGNETALLRQEEKGVYGKFGLTFDFGKLADALTAKH